MKKQWNETTRKIDFTFNDGLDPVSINPLDYPLSIQEMLPIHGALAKLGDSAAIPKDESNKFTVTEAMRRDAILGMHQQLMNGDWNAKKGTGPKQHPSILKLAAKWGCTYEEAEMKIAALDDI